MCRHLGIINYTHTLSHTHTHTHTQALRHTLLTSHTGRGSVLLLDMLQTHVPPGPTQIMDVDTHTHPLWEILREYVDTGLSLGTVHTFTLTRIFLHRDAQILTCS